MSTDENRDVLFKIFDRLGSIEARILGIEKLESKISAIEIRTQRLEQFDGRIGAIVIAASTVIGGAVFLIAEGVKYLIHKVG